jgi:protein-tyrosine-phosphatase
VNILFVCTANGGRSVISERLLQREAGDRHHVRSAGSMPGARAHPEVVEALRELGIDASDHVPQKLSQDLIDWADVVVATCDDSCPYVPGKRYVNWHLPDPKGQPIERVRDIRDDIAARVTALVRDLDAECAPA